MNRLFSTESGQVATMMEDGAVMDLLKRPGNKLPRTYKVAEGTLTCSAWRSPTRINWVWSLAYPPESRRRVTRVEAVEMIRARMEARLS